MADTKIKISADTTQADGALRSFGTSMDGIGRKIMSFSGIAGALSIGAFASKLVGIQREFDVLNSSLITVTGSSENAKKEFAWIKDFAATTPFQLTQVTEAFVKMKALGLDGTRESLTSYGNTASAMGKDLNQMIEAVADAATGEFERLKEFGIKASKQGDQVSFTFKGVTTTVRNSANEITGYLQGIGNNDFAGAMELRAKTLDGALSNLSDTWDGLFRTINEGNAGGVITDGIRLAIGAVEDMDKILGALNETTANNARETGAMRIVQDGIATVFETVAVLGVNTKYVLVQIGNEIGGLAAQAAAILTGNFAQAAEIRRMMVEDAKAARAEVDATSERILQARTKTAAQAPVLTSGGATQPPTTAGVSEKEREKAEREQSRIDAEIARQQGKYDKLAEMAILYDAKDQDRITWKLAFDLDQMDKDREKAIEHKAWNEELEASYQQARLDREAMAQSELQKMRDKELADKQAKDGLEIQFMRASFAFKKSMRIADLGNALGLLAQATEGMAMHSRKAFEINKAASIASILVKAPKIITDAYDSGSNETGSWWGGVAYAAMAAIAVGAQLSAAQGASFGGGGSVAPASGGTAGMPSSAAADQSGTSPVATPTQGTVDAPRAQADIHLHGTVFDAKTVRDLAELMNEAAADGVIFNVVTD